ncbi:DUF1428 domain-containing protein [Abyssibius alkaniclasticus]|uniref:DUF1428 domain-containing protein n=1 Tax=Abyssibius alkaniclasticus TaxID=2881234 RepID=UPI0023641F6F|nr:DUF1428 domain-containing protein [Abyssibius alkaniclasticus]UPH71633.1 DUF1428 domain-containing protein [Abyssibius alkaniclasticus]
MYIQGAVLPVKTAQKADYVKLVAAMFEVMKDYGAISTVEAWGDDVPMGENTSFPQALKLESDETVVLSWLVFPDKAARDRCMNEGMQDPRLGEIFSAMPIDGQRMIWGGFESILEA